MGVWGYGDMGVWGGVWGYGDIEIQLKAVNVNEGIKIKTKEVFNYVSNSQEIY